MPHSEIHESLLTCSSSWLIAAYRVLLRFETPRHPPYALLHLTYVNDIRYFRFILICLGKSFSVENIAYMSAQYLPCLDFLVSSVQFSVNNKSFIDYPTNRWFPVDAPSKLDNAKLWRSTSTNHASLALALLGRFRRRPAHQSSSPCGSILGQVSPRCPT